MPVTTPIAKLIRKSLPQNLVALRYFSLPVRTQAVCRPATSADRRDRQRDEEEVVDGGDAELPARQGLRRQSQVHVVVSLRRRGHSGSLPLCRTHRGATGRACERVHIHKQLCAHTRSPTCTTGGSRTGGRERGGAQDRPAARGTLPDAPGRRDGSAAPCGTPPPSCRKMSFASVSPIGDPHALARRTAGRRRPPARTPPRSRPCAPPAAATRSWPGSRAPSSPARAAPSTTRSRSATSEPTRLEQLVLGPQRGDRRVLGELAHAERHRRLAQRRGHRLVRDRRSRPAARPGRTPWRRCAARTRSGRSR